MRRLRTTTGPKPIEPSSSAASVPEEVIDAVMANVDAGCLELLGPDGVLAEFTAASSSGGWLRN